MTTEEEHSEAHSTHEHSFDELAKGLARENLTRRDALKWVGAAVVGGLLSAIPGVALAKPPPHGIPPGQGGTIPGKEGGTPPGQGTTTTSTTTTLAPPPTTTSTTTTASTTTTCPPAQTCGGQCCEPGVEECCAGRVSSVCFRPSERVCCDTSPLGGNVLCAPGLMCC